MSMTKTLPLNQLDPFLQTYMKNREDKDLSPRTVANYLNTLTIFHNWCLQENIKPKSATYEDMKAWVKSLRVLELKPSTQSRHVVHLTAVYNHAFKQGKIKRNPCFKLSDALPKIDVEEPLIYSAEECRKIVTAIETDLEERIIYSLLLTGARSFELRKLRWKKSDISDTYVDFENRQLRIKGKGGKIRFTPIHPILLDKMKVWEANDQTDCVFLSGWNRAISGMSWQQNVNRVLTRAGFETLPDRPSHTFRRTLNTSLTRQNVRPDVIEDMFGWSAKDIRGRHYTGRVSEDGHKAIAMAYQDDPILPEQTFLTIPKQTESVDEVELLRLKLAVLEAENENLRLKSQVA